MTFYRKLDAGAARIAAILDERGVVVRRPAASVSRGRNSGRRSSPVAGGRSLGRKYF